MRCCASFGSSLSARVDKTTTANSAPLQVVELAERQANSSTNSPTAPDRLDRGQLTVVPATERSIGWPRRAGVMSGALDPGRPTAGPGNHRSELAEDLGPVRRSRPLQRYKRDYQEGDHRRNTDESQREHRDESRQDYPHFGLVRGAHLTGAANHARAYAVNIAGVLPVLLGQHSSGSIVGNPSLMRSERHNQRTWSGGAGPAAYCCSSSTCTPAVPNE